MTVAVKKIRMHNAKFKGRLSRAAKFVIEQEEQVLLDLEGINLRMEKLQKGFQSYKEWILQMMLLIGDEECDGEVEVRYFGIMSRMQRFSKAGSVVVCW